MYMENQPDLKAWLRENDIQTSLILGADALDHVIFDEDSDLDQECYDALPVRFSNGFILSNNLSISPITIPIVFKDAEGNTRIPFEDEKRLFLKVDTAINSFLEVKAPQLEVQITSIGYTTQEDDRGDFTLDETVIFTRSLQPKELDDLIRELGYSTNGFKRMVAGETFLSKNGPIPFRDNICDQLFDSDTYEKRVSEREKLLSSIEKILGKEEIHIPRDQIRIENDYATNTNLNENDIVVGNYKENIALHFAGKNGIYYKGTVKDGEMVSGPLFQVNKVAFQDEERREEFHMPHTMKFVLGLRASELGLERKDIELRTDKAVLNTDGDRKRFDHLYIRPLSKGQFVPMDEISIRTIGMASVFSAVATAPEAEKWNREHSYEVDPFHATDHIGSNDYLDYEEFAYDMDA